LSLPVEAGWDSGESLRSSFIRQGMESRPGSPSVWEALSSSLSLVGELVVVVVSVLRIASWSSWREALTAASVLSRHSVRLSASTNPSAFSELAIFMLVESRGLEVRLTLADVPGRELT
jgi:hypothetical protein